MNKVCVAIKMTTLMLPKFMVGQAHYPTSSRYTAGHVGSVGSTINSIQAQTTSPDDPIRYLYSGYNTGSKCTDGDYDLSSHVIQQPYNDRSQVLMGYNYVDIRPQAMLYKEPMLQQIPQLSWRDRVASAFNTKIAGSENFIPGNIPLAEPTPNLVISQVNRPTSLLLGQGNSRFTQPYPVVGR